MDEDGATDAWKIPARAYKQVVSHLDSGHDEVVRFYAGKTIENITAQSVNAGQQFASKDTAEMLLHCYRTSTIDGFKVSAAVTISHICKLNAELFPYIFTEIKCDEFCKILCDSTPRVQQSFITMLNVALI